MSAALQPYLDVIDRYLALMLDRALRQPRRLQRMHSAYHRRRR